MAERKRSFSLYCNPVGFATLRRNDENDEKPKKLSRKYILQTELQFKDYIRDECRKDLGNVNILESIVLSPNLEKFNKPAQNTTPALIPRKLEKMEGSVQAEFSKKQSSQQEVIEEAQIKINYADAKIFDKEMVN